MTISLTPAQLASLEDEVRAGRFASVEEGVRTAVDLLMPLDVDDLEWARPHLDEARAAVARGETVGFEEFSKTMARHIERLGGAK